MFAEEPFVRSTFGQAYSRSVNLLMERLDLFATIAAIMFIPNLLMRATFTIKPDFSQATAEDPYGLGPEFQANLMAHLGLFIAEFAFIVFAGAVGQAAISLAVARMYVGSRPETVPTLKAGASHFCHLFGASVLAGVIGFVVSFVTTFLAILCWATDVALFKLFAVLVVAVGSVLYIFVYVSMMIVVPVIALEKKGPVEGVKRAWELSNNNRCYIFCTSFCLGLAFFVLGLIMAIVLFDGFFGLILKQLPFLFSFPLSSILVTVVYLNIRIENEGLNADVLLRELDGNSAVDYASVISVMEEAGAPMDVKQQKPDSDSSY